jgi:voltage-gated potassium channel
MKHMTKAKLRNIVDNNTTKEGAIFDYVIQVLILISLVGYALETLPDNSLTMQSIFEWIETVCVILFTIEYGLRIYVAQKPLKYIFSFYGLVDFLAIFPFYVSTSTGFVTLRAFRVFRIFRTFKLIRYNKALKRFQQAWKIIREEVILYLIVTLVFLFLASAGIYYFENPVQPEKFTSIFSSGYWAIVTLTTVGYGDIYPITAGGRIFTFFILMIGVGIVTIPAGLVASALTKAREMEEEAHQAMNEEITVDAYKEKVNDSEE